MKRKMVLALTLVLFTGFVSAQFSSIDSVEMNDLPSNADKGETIQIEGSAEGSSLHGIYIYVDETGDDFYNVLKEGECEGSSCQVEASYSGDTGEVSFQVSAEAGIDREIEKDSGSQTVRFKDDDEGGGFISVDKVRMNNLPDTVPEDEKLKIEGSAEGNDLSDISVLYDDDGDDFYNSLRTRSCSGDECSIDAEFSGDAGDKVSFQVDAIAGNDPATGKDSGSQTVRFIEPDDGTTEPPEPPEEAEGPSANIHVSDTSPSVGETVSFDAFDSEPGDFPIKEYRWYLPDGDTVFDRSFSRSFDSTGERRVSLQVTDTEGNTDTDRVTVDVQGERQASLRVTIKDEDNDRLENAEVRLTNSYEKTDRTDEDGESRFRNLEEGEHTVRVKCEGETETRDKFIDQGDSESIIVKLDTDISDDYCEDESERLNAQISVSDSNPFIGESVRFDGTGSEGDIKEYRWEFGDGSIRYGSTLFKSFSSEGSEQVWLTVTDTEGNTDTDSITLNVEEKRQCRIHIGDISFMDEDTADDEAEAELSISNRGDPQEANVKLFVENEEVSDVDTEIGTGAERRFSTNFTDNVGTDIRAEIRTSGDPCGSGFFERSGTFRDDIAGDRKPRAQLDIDPDSADTGEEIDFDATDSEDPDGEIEEYEFDIDGDGDYDVSNDDGEVERTFFEELDQTARVRVTDNDGNTDTASASYRVRAKSRVSFSDIDIPDDVCAGESFDVTFDARNIGDDERVLIVEGEGFGDRNSYSTHLEEDEEEEVTITFTTDEPGTEEFTIRSVGGNSDTIENTIEVLDCETTGGEVEGISMKLVPDRVRAGEAVKVSGYVENARGRQDVRIEMNGRRMTELSTEPDGYYSTYIYPERTGRVQISAESGEFRAVRDLNVLPTVSVGSMDIPETVFQGDEMEVCAEVNSQNIPAVLLVVDGEIVESKNERGEVCFETTAKKQGDVTYEVVGLARGQRSTSEREVEVHEAKPEASSFPGQVASVESGRGIVKSTIYNNNNDRRTEYYVSIRGLPDTWTSTTEKQVILQPGEQREVFFYLTPREEGTYDPLVTITSGTEIVHTEEVDVEVGGTSKPRNLSLFERLRNAFL